MCFLFSLPCPFYRGHFTMRCIFICIDFLYHAPTAMNQQKFYFELKEGKIKAKPGFGFYTKIDLGIAKYNFEIGAGRENFSWFN